MPYENINAQLNDADFDKIKLELSSIISLLPFLVNLTKMERQQKGAYVRQKEMFTIKAFEIATNENNLFPSNNNMLLWENNLKLLQQLQTISRITAQLQEGLTDTIIALKSDTAKNASRVYNSLKIQAKDNVPGVDAMLDTLKNTL